MRSKIVLGVVFSLLLMIAQIGVSQTVIKTTNGQTEVTGIDPFGAQVKVVYDKTNRKVYQERTFDGETVFARYGRNGLEEYGILYRPVVLNSPVPSFKIGD